MSFFKSWFGVAHHKWFGEKTYLGVDIGTTSIKVVEMSGKKLVNYGILQTYGYLNRFNDALQTSSLKLLETETAKYLKELISRAKIKSDEVIASLPAFSGFTTLIELPEMPESETAKAIGFQARQYIPMSLSVVTLDWMRVGERTDENGVKKQQIFLVAMLNEQIEKYKKIFKLAGLKLVALELEGISLARSLTRGLKEPALIIDIGARSSSFSIAQNGLLKFVGQSDFAGGSLTQALSSGLGISVRRAEELKQKRGLKGVGGEQELSTLMKPLLDVIINEGGRIKSNYENSYKEAVKRVILTGGGARLEGVKDYIGSQLNLPAEIGNPLAKVEYPVTLRPRLNDLNISLAIALGLGIKYAK
ncbi:MAG: type IV pilus assembly protein PilM [Patescibacteria group bacterium]